MQAKKGFKNMKIIATSDELKDLRNLFIQGFTSLDDKDRTELEDKIKDLLILNDLSEADIKRHCNRNEELIGDITKLSKEIDNLNLENSKVYHRNKELEETSKKFIDLNTELEKELKQIKTISYDNLNDSYNSLNEKYSNLSSGIKKVLDTYNEPSLKYLHINVLTDIKQYL